MVLAQVLCVAAVGLTFHTPPCMRKTADGVRRSVQPHMTSDVELVELRKQNEMLQEVLVQHIPYMLPEDDELRMKNYQLQDRIKALQIGRMKGIVIPTTEDGADGGEPRAEEEEKVALYTSLECSTFLLSRAQGELAKQQASKVTTPGKPPNADAPQPLNLPKLNLPGVNLPTVTLPEVRLPKISFPGKTGSGATRDGAPPTAGYTRDSAPAVGYADIRGHRNAFEITATGATNFIKNPTGWFFGKPSPLYSNDA